MSYQPVRTDDGLEVRDEHGNLVAGPFESVPPRDPDGVDDLFDAANISQPTRDLLKILFDIAEYQDERSGSNQ